MTAQAALKLKLPPALLLWMEYEVTPHTETLLVSVSTVVVGLMKVKEPVEPSVTES